MSPTAQQLLASALALPEAERVELVGALLDAWEAEMNRRQAESQAGTVTFTPWREVIRRARERLEERALIG